jgi:hypothetical protein
MKKSIIWYIVTWIILVVSSIVFLQDHTFAQLSTIDNTSPTITQDITKVIDSTDLDNPLRKWSRFGIESPDWSSVINVINVSEILWFDQAQNATLWLIQNIINILLSFTTLIVLIYLIYEWYMIVTAGTDEWQYKKALARLKNAAIAIAGIAVSRFIVSFIFAALNTII